MKLWLHVEEDCAVKKQSCEVQSLTNGKIRIVAYGFFQISLWWSQLPKPKEMVEK